VSACGNARSEAVHLILSQAVHGCRAGHFLPAHRRVDTDIEDIRSRRGAHEEYVSAEAPAGDCSFGFARRGTVGVGEEDRLERQGQHPDSQMVGGARTTTIRDFQFAAGEMEFARALAVDMNHGIRIEVFDLQSDAASGPLSWDGQFPMVPRGEDCSERARFPGGVGVDRLTVFLHVVGDAGPASRDFEVPPVAIGNPVIVRIGRLPLPKTIETNPLAGGGGFAMRFVHLPDRLDTFGKCHGGLGVRVAGAGEREEAGHHGPARAPESAAGVFEIESQCEAVHSG